MDKKVYISYLQELVVAGQRVLFFSELRNKAEEELQRVTGSIRSLEDQYNMEIKAKNNLESEVKALKAKRGSVAKGGYGASFKLPWDHESTYKLLGAMAAGFFVFAFIFSWIWTWLNFQSFTAYMCVVIVFAIGCPLLFVYCYYSKEKSKYDGDMDGKRKYELSNIDSSISQIEIAIARHEQKENDIDIQKKAKMDEQHELNDYIAYITSFEQSAQATLSAYYGVNLLYPTYHTYDASVHILELLLSGKCDELVGPNGAYRLYDLERRLDSMIASLNSINRSINSLIPYLDAILHNLRISVNYTVGTSVGVHKMSSLLVDSNDNLQKQNNVVSIIESRMNQIQCKLTEIRNFDAISAVQNDQMARLPQYKTFALENVVV